MPQAWQFGCLTSAAICALLQIQGNALLLHPLLQRQTCIGYAGEQLRQQRLEFPQRLQGALQAGGVTGQASRGLRLQQAQQAARRHQRLIILFSRRDGGGNPACQAALEHTPQYRQRLKQVCLQASWHEPKHPLHRQSRLRGCSLWQQLDGNVLHL